MSTLGDLTYNHIGRSTVTIDLGNTIVKGIPRVIELNKGTTYAPRIEVTLGIVELPPLAPWIPCLIREHDAKGD